MSRIDRERERVYGTREQPYLPFGTVFAAALVLRRRRPAKS